MQLFSEWIPFTILVLVTAWMIYRDPRRMRCALAATLVLFTLLQYFLGGLASLMDQFLPPEISERVSIGILLLGFLMILGFALFLMWAGAVLLRREGLSPSHSLSLVLGVAIIGYLALVYLAIRMDNLDLGVLLGMLGVPIMFFSYLLTSYVLYSAVYGFITKRWGKSGQSTVVLGSGLIGDRVPPLLARRVDLGVQRFELSWPVWSDPALVMSGGQGSDEVVSEGEAMMLYAETTHPILATMPTGGARFIEDQSVNTRQNLQFSQQILLESGRSGPWTVVTSNFHAFRAANLMSRMGIAGNAVGAKTRSYFWASAKLREFLAMLSMSKGTTIFFTLMSFVPFLMIIGVMIMR